MDTQTLARYIARAPAEPGVYTWRDSRRRPLYIGKAANLKSRLSSYPRTTDPKIRTMIGQARTLWWQTTGTDIEALITESRLIKAWRPTYNVALRDDKQYFYVAVTDEPFPQFLLTHQHASTKIKKPIKELIGPFTEGLPLKSTLRILRTLFPYCSCKQKHHVRCLNAHIGKCPGYCCLKAPSSKLQAISYRGNIRAVRDILTGRRDTLIRTLERRMKTAGRAHDLEQAARLQRQAERVRRVFENAQINARTRSIAAQHHGALEQAASELGLRRVPRRIEGYDIANISGQHATGSMVVFTDGRADRDEYRLFNIRTVQGSNDTAMLREVLARRLAHPEWRYPDLILVDGGRAQLNAALATLAELKVSISVISLTKNDRHQGDHIYVSSSNVKVQMSKLEPIALKRLPESLKNLILHVDSEAHRFAIRQYRRLHGRALVE